jgi:ribonuclease P protein component
MLKKANRLSRMQFTEYFRLGKRHHFEHLTVIYCPNLTFFAAVVVGKKVSKGAVRRNTLKRRVLARLAQVQKEWVVTGVFIIILKPSFNSLPRTAADEFFHKSIAGLLQST